MSNSVRDRFDAKWTEDENGCWIWIAGTQQKSGYGKFWNGSFMGVAHRMAWELYRGPIPAGLNIDHLCRVTKCVRPEHLEPVTQAENVRRGAHGLLLTACPQGHDYTPENTYVSPSNGSRICRACHRDKNREYARRVASLKRSHAA